jgi:hypothetical protein
LSWVGGYSAFQNIIGRCGSREDSVFKCEGKARLVSCWLSEVWLDVKVEGEWQKNIGRCGWY